VQSAYKVLHEEEIEERIACGAVAITEVNLNVVVREVVCRFPLRRSLADVAWNIVKRDRACDYVLIRDFLN